MRLFRRSTGDDVVVSGFRFPVPAAGVSAIRDPRSTRKGSVLIVALGALTALSLIAVAFATTMRLESMATLNYTRTVQEELMARAAFEYALSLVKGDTNNTDSKTDAWHYENAAFVFKGAPTDTNLTMPPGARPTFRRRPLTG